MTNLTDKWQKGELPFGAYYVNRLEEHRIWLYSDRSQTYDNSYEIYEVLAPVPSYEKWQEKLDENTKLKELLKECKALLSCLKIDDYDGNGLLVLTKINKVLGEE